MSSFSGKIVVVTGFAKDERTVLEGLLEAAGATVTTKVSAKTHVLVTGPKPGPEKLMQAQDAGAEIIDGPTARSRLGG